MVWKRKWSLEWAVPVLMVRKFYATFLRLTLCTVLNTHFADSSYHSYGVYTMTETETQTGTEKKWLA